MFKFSGIFQFTINTCLSALCEMLAHYQYILRCTLHADNQTDDACWCWLCGMEAPTHAVVRCVNSLPTLPGVHCVVWKHQHLLLWGVWTHYQYFLVFTVWYGSTNTCCCGMCELTTNTCCCGVCELTTNTCWCSLCGMEAPTLAVVGCVNS